MKAGTAAAALVFVPTRIDAHPREEDRIRDRKRDAPVSIVRRLAVRPGVFENIDDPTDGSLWAFDAGASQMAEILSSSVMLDEPTVFALTSDDATESALDQPTADFIRALQRVRIIGGYGSPEVAGAIVRGVLLDEPFDVALEFYRDQDQDSISTQPTDIVDGMPIIVRNRGRSSGAVPFETPYRNITVGSWRLQFRPNHSPGKGHKMGGCAPDGSPHIHFDICYNRSGSRWDVINTLHIGKYTQSGKKCLFISNDPEKSSRSFCKKICVPTIRDLEGMYQSAFANGAAAANVKIAAWLLAAIASAAAAATYAGVFAL